MRTSPAFTLVEILIVIAILSMISVGAYFSLFNSGNNQALAASAEIVAGVARQAHISSREVKDYKTWGIASNDTKKSLQLLSFINGPGATTIEKDYQLEPEVNFENNFTVWFAKGTGAPPNTVEIRLVNKQNNVLRVLILSTGVIEVAAE